VVGDANLRAEPDVGCGRHPGPGSTRSLFDRTNLIRLAEGIGIFQSAYGPKFTIQDTITLLF
jgi:hypothetical protein